MKRVSIEVLLIALLGSGIGAWFFFAAAEQHRAEATVSRGVTNALTDKLLGFLEGQGLGSDLDGTARCSWSCVGRLDAIDCTVVIPPATVCGVTCTTSSCAWAADCKR